MAAGFKTATVNASDVPATLTNYPSYVDLSLLGITTLAEAQSVRVYADSGKTTEWAREIVSATEMHVKVPSLTSTTPIYVDWDGVRADYAATDTYGRNNTWPSTFQAVQHFEGNSNDSTANARNGTDTSITYSSGKLGQAASTTNGKVALPSFSLNASFSVLMWAKLDAAGSVVIGWSTYNGSGPGTGTAVLNISRNAAFPVDCNYSNFAVEASEVGSMAQSTWVRVAVTHNGTTPIIYHNASNLGSSGTVGHVTTSRVFNYFSNGHNTSQRMNGAIDEAYIINSQVSADWITTEYNNQSDVAGFWGTWTDAGGGGPTPTYSNFLMMGVG